MLVNLIVNAVKFTDEGEVLVTVSMGDQGASDRKELIFSVSDTGIGVPENYRQSIFEKFTQVDASTKRSVGGVGLGLSICKSLVELMGGRIWLESLSGGGSKFCFSLPWGYVSEDSQEREVFDERLKGKLALVLYGNNAGSGIVEKILSQMGIQVSVSQDSKACSQMLRNTGALPDLLVLDSACRDTDEIIKYVKNEPKLSAAKIVLLTPLGSSGTEDINADRTVLKPVRPETLRRVINGQLLSNVPVNGESVKDITVDEDHTHGTGNGSPGGERINTSIKKVLVVDDTDDNKKLAKRMLELGGYEVDLAGSGAESVAAFCKQSYDVILMDLQMPVMDGFDATKAIRAREQQGDRTPIIAVTAHAIVGYREKCLKNGMDDYITKPLRKKRAA